MIRHDVKTQASTKQAVRALAQQAKLPTRSGQRGCNGVLGAPVIEAVHGVVLDPSLQTVVVRVTPYSGMACGDRLILSWTGVDIEGVAYRHEVIRFVSQLQVGKDVVFVVRSAHIAALDGGLLEVFWILTRAGSAESVTSTRLQLDVGDVRYRSFAAIIDDAIAGHLDPKRVAHGTTVTIAPYPLMAAGDRVLLIWRSLSADAALEDQLVVEPFAVGQSLVFGIAPRIIAEHADSEVTVRYRIERKNRVILESEVTRVMIAPLARGTLDAPKILGASDGRLDLQVALGGISVLISDAQVEEGELVYLKCDGESFSHREDRDITGEMASQPLVFIVPYEFWEEHADTEVRVSYSIERLDDVSQLSGATLLRVQP